MSCPGRRSSAAFIRRDGSLTRGSSAAADATITRAVPRASAWSARARADDDADVRCHAAVRVDFVRRKAQNCAIGRCVGQSFERRHEEAHIAHRLFELAIARNHVENDAAGQGVRRRGHIEGLGGIVETGYGVMRRRHAAAGDCLLEDRAHIERAGRTARKLPSLHAGECADPTPTAFHTPRPDTPRSQRPFILRFHPQRDPIQQPSARRVGTSGQQCPHLVGVRPTCFIPSMKTVQIADKSCIAHERSRGPSRVYIEGQRISSVERQGGDRVTRPLPPTVLDATQQRPVKLRFT